MESLYTVRHAEHYPDEYLKAWQEMPLDYQPYAAHCAKGGHLDDYERRARGEAPLYTGPRGGQAIRTGITNPGYRSRAVYRIQNDHASGYTYEPGYWVYDGGKLIEVGAWHADPANRETTPAQAPKRTRRAAK
jgi:hypothetical protein